MEEPSVNGTCLLMCPLQEIEMRQREGLVHILESFQGKTSSKGKSFDADRCKMVKMFCRSAAGKDMFKPQDLRPPPVLKKTVNYLLSRVVCDTQVSWVVVYGFVTDRLRAIRQDLVIQQPPPAVCCTILEPIVRFHAYSAYRLCEEPLGEFDPVLNKTHLNESLKQLLVCYDAVAAARDESELDPTRDQMEALYGLLHLGHEDALLRMLSLKIPKGSLLKIALQLSLADFRNDYVNVCRILKRLPALLACTAAIHLPRIRRNALIVMNCAYSSKNLRFPISCLKSILLYSGNKEVVEDCHHYGITVEENTRVHFLKESFDLSIKESKPKRLQFIDDSIAKLPLPELLLSPG